MKLIVLVGMCAVAWGQSGIGRPQLGEMLDQRGSLRRVFGVTGSFTVDEPRAARVLSTTCSRALCVAKTDSAILLGHTTMAAPSGPALIAVDGVTALIYFTETRQFARWQAGILSMFDLSVEGQVLSVQSTQAGIKLAVRRANGVWIVSDQGVILDSLPPAAKSVLLTDSGVVYTAEDSLILRRADASELHFAAAGVTDLFAMGEDYIQARAGSIIYALRIAAGRESLFFLPSSSAPLTEHRK